MTRGTGTERSTFGREEVRLYEATSAEIVEYDLQSSIGLKAEPGRYWTMTDFGLEFTRTFYFDGNLAVWYASG